MILLRYTELRSQLYRLLSILKMRESRYDTSIREFQITGEGIRVARTFQSADAILTAHARAAAAALHTHDEPSLDHFARGAGPDVVLMDVMMPRISGLEVLREMRETPELREIPVILMSVIAPSVRREDYGWQAFLHKPFTLAGVVKAVNQLAPHEAGKL